MSLVEVKRSVKVASDEMREMIRFIDNSLKGDNASLRRLLADKQYLVELTTTHGNVSETTTLVIEKGATFQFHPKVGARTTNKELLMVNANGHGWGINLIDGSVRYFRDEIHVSTPSAVQLPSAKLTGNRGAGHT